MARDHSTDLRVRKTITAIDQAFSKLLETTEYSKITISSIARAAHINRKTFYLHFDSVDDLLCHQFTEAIKDLVNETAAKVPFEDTNRFMRTLVNTTVHRLDESKALTTNVVNHVSAFRLATMVKEPLLEHIAAYRRKAGLDTPDELGYCVTSLIGGMWAAYADWRTNPGPKMSLDELGAVMYRIARGDALEMFSPNPAATK
jgi:AcrR family transcriptional regulator